MKATEPEIRTDGRLELKRARHPLITGKTVVPISVRLGSDFDTLIITGPNTGGKTVTLKTHGFADAHGGVRTAHSGGRREFRLRFRPRSCRHRRRAVDRAVALDLLLAYEKHCRYSQNLRRFDSLILFDELCAGTDPAEGAALAISLIEFCRKCGSKIAATTHYAELKLYAMRTSGVINASCEFNVETLQPTYRLLIGIPGKSNAFAISKRLGLDDAILEDARSMVSQNDVNFEDVLDAARTAAPADGAGAGSRPSSCGWRRKSRNSSPRNTTQQIQKEKEKAAAQARKEAQ